jgi:hypothetical protein
MKRALMFWCRLLPALGLGLLSPTTVSAQDGEAQPLRLISLSVSGVHSSLTESWGTLELALKNPNASARDGRLLVFFSDQPDVQYGRDVWIPARSTVSTWMLVGPPPQQGAAHSRELQALLYDRTGGQDRLVLPPGQERVRALTEIYRQRELLTTVMLDSAIDESGQETSDSGAEDALRLVRLFRQDANLSEHVNVVYDRFLPPTADAFDGVDHFVLADRRLVHDPPGQLALRRWLEQGGRLWVMLDLADLGVVAQLLGDRQGFQVVDRTSLTTVRIRSQVPRPGVDETVQEFDQPVDFVRVLPAPGDRVLQTVDGWPASFTRQVGRGKVVFTALGARGWFRLRTAADFPSPWPHFPDLPVAMSALEELTPELQPPRESRSFQVDAFQPLLNDEIGYSIIGVGTVGLIFGAFLVVVFAVGLGLRHWRRPELLGWLGPAAALAAAGTFFALGEVSRRSVPPTVAVVQMVEAAPGGGDQPVTGLLAVYRPVAGPAPVGSTQGGLLDLDMTGLEGQTRRFVVTDTDTWHWENLALPAGLRLAPFRYTARTGQPLKAVGHFGPNGVEGRLTPGSFRGLADALVSTPTGEAVAVRLRPDGTFTAANADLLPPRQYLTGAVLSDLQQGRQAVYRRLMGESGPSNLEDRAVLLAWAEPLDMPFTFEPGARTAGSALLMIPLEWERPPPGTQLTVPQAFVACRRILQGRRTRPTLESKFAADMDLRFQVPSALLPLKVEGARLFATIKAPLRRVTVSGHADGKRAELLAVESPTDPIRLDIVREDLLRLDAEGGLHVQFSVSDLLRPSDGKGAANEDSSWTIEALELEVTGRTLPEE